MPMVHLAGHYYHVYNRGCNRECIFTEDENYLYLLRTIKDILPSTALKITAYCLMPNHYHFLFRCEADEAVARFIQRLFNGYTQAFNRRNKRNGTLFESRAKSIEVDTEYYALCLCRYIHLNPVVAGLVSQPADWPFSNCREWIGQRAGTLVDREFVATYFRNPEEYGAYVNLPVDELTASKLSDYYLD